MLVAALAFLAAGWFGVEVLHHLRITLFQPFRVATVVRGLAIVLIAGRVVWLWDRPGGLGRTRAVLLAIGFTGDWLLVVVTLAEVVTTLVERMVPRLDAWAFTTVLAWGVWFLSRHDTESGHWPLLAALGVGLALIALRRGMVGRGVSSQIQLRLRPARIGFVCAAAWTIPLLALAANLVPASQPMANTAIVRGLVARCRFAQVPLDEIERLAVWCRDKTPQSSRFLGPPGPKTFRLWSRRNLAFNRAGSPYHAEGLADWFARFQDHVNVHSPPEEFVRQYLAGRHRLEARYLAMDDHALADLAIRQGASHVLARAPCDGFSPAADALEHLHTEGNYAVYRVNPVQVVQRQR